MIMKNLICSHVVCMAVCSNTIFKAVHVSHSIQLVYLQQDN